MVMVDGNYLGKIEYIMEKKLYYIVCDHEFVWRDTEKYLSDAEVEVIKDIFKDLSSPYIYLYMEEIPTKEKFKKDCLSIINSEEDSYQYKVDKIKNLYNISTDTALYLYNKYKDEKEFSSKETIKKLYDTARDIAAEFHNKYKNELKK